MKLLVALFVLVLCTASFAQDMSDVTSLDVTPPSPPTTVVEVPTTNTPATVDSPPTTDIPPTTVDVPPATANTPPNAYQGVRSTRPARYGSYSSSSSSRSQRSRGQGSYSGIANFVRDDLNARPGTIYGAVRQVANQAGLGQITNRIPTVGSLLGLGGTPGSVGGFVRDDLNARPGTIYGAVRQAANQAGLGQITNSIPTVGSLLGVGGEPGQQGEVQGQTQGGIANFVRDDLNARPGTIYGAVRQVATQAGLGQISNSVPTVGSLLGLGGAPGQQGQVQGQTQGGLGGFLRNDLNARPGTIYGAVRQAANQAGLGQITNSIPTVGALLGLNAVGDQNSEFAAPNSNASSEMPSWAVALIVLGVLVLLGTIAISVQFALMLRHV